jgi:hypothetical protein
MIKTNETQKALNKFAKDVMQGAKNNLDKKNSSFRLWKSLDSELTVNPNSFSLSFEMLNYGVFQDRGVDGVEQKHNAKDYEGNNIAFKRKGGGKSLKGMPPPKAFDKWSVKRGIAPRDKQGKFLSRESANFAIARGVFLKGIKPSFFFTKPFEKQFTELPDQLIQAYGLDVENFLKFTLKK